MFGHEYERHDDSYIVSFLAFETPTIRLELVVGSRKMDRSGTICCWQSQVIGARSVYSNALQRAGVLWDG